MENQVENASPEAGSEAQRPELSITDLQNLRAIVDVAVRRGTFNASEISSVGAVFDRVNGFLNAVAPAPADAPNETAQAPTA
jgi:hypothetical protein